MENFIRDDLIMDDKNMDDPNMGDLETEDDEFLDLDDLHFARDVLHDCGFALVIARVGALLHTSKESGIFPLFHAALSAGDYIDAYVADKVIGKAAALLLLYMKVAGVYTPVMSKDALRILKDRGVRVEADNVVEYIADRNGKGPCPLEITVKDIGDDPREGLAAIAHHFKEMFNVDE